MFGTYLKLGFDHILDLNGYDHILFLIALCAAFAYYQWKKILILVTAFTIGHTITLAMSSLDVITISADLIELLIPVTIFITALLNFVIPPSVDKRWLLSYWLPLVFGFIHGMGFSNFFKSLLGRGGEIILPLFSFNLGVELGQIIIVLVIMLVNYVLVGLLKLNQRTWNVTVSILAAILAIKMIIDKF